ncbi:MAG: hypothetical protein P8I99_08705 [Acidimicrobiales bacterium]|nr:hypothetical protein [Acidimicrobiales bacterium]MDG1877480.1 hypothetical protein [Acidimicrobiales bacterium]
MALSASYLRQPAHAAPAGVDLLARSVVAMPVDGVEIDVRATFEGSDLFVSKNNLSPLLRLFDDYPEIKVMKGASFPNRDIQSVDVKTEWMANNLAFCRGGK